MPDVPIEESDLGSYYSGQERFLPEEKYQDMLFPTLLL